MSVLESFYILFKTNADEVKKGMKEVDKATKETEKSLRNSNEEAAKLGASLVKIVEGAAGLAGAAAGYALVKQGILSQQEYNKQLAVTGDILGMNAGKMKVIAQLAAESGGSREGGLAELARLQNLWTARGGKGSFDFDAWSRAVHRDLLAKHMTKNQQGRYLTDQSGYGMTDPGLIRAVMMSDEEYAAAKKSAGVASMTDKDAAAALAANKSFEHLAGAKGSMDTTSGTTLFGKIDQLIDKLSEFIKTISGSGKASLAADAAIIGGSTVGTGYAARLGMKGLKGALGLGKTAPKLPPAALTEEAVATTGIGAEGFAGMAGGATEIGLGVAAGMAGVVGGFAVLLAKTFPEKAFQALADWAETPGWAQNGNAPNINKTTVGGSIGPYGGAYPAMLTASLKQGQAAGGGDIAFWMSKGYSKEQAAGIVANMQAESGGNPGSVGDSGLARGLFQWHPDRQKSILAGTGIDVRTASRDQQMEAAAWEMKNGRPGFDDSYYRSLTDPTAAGAYFSQRFEGPRDVYGEASKRGSAAAQISAGYQGSAGSSTVNVTGPITIQTQATTPDEIAKHFKDALIGECGNLQAQADNGRAA